MGKVVAGLAITLDGVVHSPAEWLMLDDELTAEIDVEFANADAILLGRHTYLEFAKHWPELGDTSPMAKCLNETPKFVVSNTLKTAEWEGTSLLDGSIVQRVSVLREREGHDVLIPGSPRLVRSLLGLGLLDELRLLVHPIVLNRGQRLFEGQAARFDLQLVNTKAFRSGVLAATYRATC